jgi:hypothetical protein
MFHGCGIPALQTAGLYIISIAAETSTIINNEYTQILKNCKLGYDKTLLKILSSQLFSFLRGGCGVPYFLLIGLNRMGFKQQASNPLPKGFMRTHKNYPHWIFKIIYGIIITNLFGSS